MKNKTACFIIILISLVFTFKVTGQNKTVQKSIVNIFTDLENKFEVRFSYNPEIVSNISILPPSENFSLDQTLSYLEKSTPFSFTKVDDRYITVLLKNKNLLCGTLLNAYTGEILRGASINTIDNTYQTSTDDTGKFYIPASLVQKNLKIHFLGYETSIIPVKSLDVSCSPVLLVRSIDNLDTVILNSYLTKGITKEKTGSITLNTDKFGLLPGQTENDVLQLIQALPGIESVDETVSNINMRGGTKDETIILWEDIKMYQTSHFFGLISAFNPDITKNITIYKNGTNAKYGDAVSGTIIMQSNEKIADSISGTLGVNLINGSANVSVPISKKLGIQVSGRKSITEVFKSATYSKFIDKIFQDTEISNTQNNTLLSNKINFSFFDFSPKIIWNFNPNNTIELNTIGINNQLNIIETNIETQQTKESNLNQENYSGSIKWTNNWNTKFTSSVILFGTSYLLNAVNKDVFSTQEQFQENKILETGIKIDTKLNYSNTAKWQFGYHFIETGISNTQDVNLPRLRVFNKEVLRSHAIYGNLIYNPRKNTTINAGLRGNYFEKFSSFIFEPRLSINQKLSKSFFLDLQGEFKSQTTTQRIDLESDFLGVEKRRWTLVNDKDLPIIKSKQASIGLTYKKQGWFVNLELFYKRVTGINTSNQGFQNQFQFIKSSGKYVAKGSELVINKKIQKFSFWLSYVFMNNDYTFKDIFPDSFPNNIDIRHSATLASSYLFKNLKLSAGLNWRTGKPYTTLVNGNEIVFQNNQPTLNFNAPNSSRLPNYYRLNLSSQYQFNISPTSSFNISFALLNALNTDNVLNIRYKLNLDQEGNPIIDTVKNKSLGISPNFSFQFIF